MHQARVSSSKFACQVDWELDELVELDELDGLVALGGLVELDRLVALNALAAKQKGSNACIYAGITPLLLAITTNACK